MSQISFLERIKCLNLEQFIDKNRNSRNIVRWKHADTTISCFQHLKCVISGTKCFHATLKSLDNENWNNCALFTSYLLQVCELVKFMIEHCQQILGEDPSSLFGGPPQRCNTDETGSGRTSTDVYLIFCSSLNWRGINSRGICLLPAHLLHMFWDLSWAATDNFANSLSVFPTSVFLFFLNSCRVSWTIRLVDVPSDRLILRQPGERAGQQQRWLTGLLQQKAAQTKTATGKPGLHPHIQRLWPRPRHRPRYASDPNRQPAWVKNQRQEAGPRPLLPRPGCATCGQLVPPGLPVSGWAA